MSNAEAVEARVRRFAPRGLSEPEWALAREVVVELVVRAEPASVEQAKILASRLCSFLAWLPLDGWDRVGVPDLARVLTVGRVEAFTSREGMPAASRRSRDAYRVQLNRLTRAANGLGRLREGRREGAPTVARSFWPTVKDRGPFPVLVRAYAASGGSLHGTVWAGLLDDLAVDLVQLPMLRGASDDRGLAANARAASNGTVVGVQAAAAMLRDAKAPTVGVVPASTGIANDETNQTLAAPKVRVSRAAAIRAAKEARAAREALASMPPVADVPALPDDLAAMLVGWTPQNLDEDRWQMIEAAVVVGVAAYKPTSPANLRNVRSIVVGYAAWLHARPHRTDGGALREVEFLADGLVDAYIGGTLAGEPNGSRATARSVLRRVVQNLNPRPKPEVITYQPVQGPYTEAECTRFATLARNQPTVPLRRSLSAMVALGLGAGLGAEDQRAVAPCHVREVDLGEHGSALAVDVPGPRARTVIVRAEYEPLLREALDLHSKARRGNSTPLCGVKPDRKNGANRVAARAITATGTGVDVDAARLRATWLVACMSAAVPLGALLHAAGLRTPRTLADLLPYCPPADPEAVAAVLRATGSQVAS